jgi:hypothetical protein
VNRASDKADDIRPSFNKNRKIRERPVNNPSQLIASERCLVGLYGL